MVTSFNIRKSGKNSDGKSWYAYCRDESGVNFQARGKTAMQALHALFLEINDDEAGVDAATDGSQPVLPSNSNKPTDSAQ
jgi:hypothetical protein